MSKIYVDEIAGIASANTVAIPGHVIQVVSSGEISTNENTTSTSFVNSAITVTITPKASDSKILVNAYFYMMVAGAARSRGAVQLVRTIGGTTTTLSGGIAETLHIRDSAAGASTEFAAMQSYQYYDTPGTTDAVTYTIQYKITNGTNVYMYGTASNAPKNIVATEIAG